MVKKIVNGAAKERKIRVNVGQSTSFLWKGENVFQPLL